MPTLSRRASWATATLVAGLALWASASPTMVYPLYAATWHVTPALTAAIFAAYPVLLIPTLIIFGNLSDAVGRRLSILIGLVLLAAGTAVFGIAPELGWVFVGRALMGIGVGLALSPATAAIVEFGNPNRAHRASSTTTVATATGLALATIVGGALVRYAPNPLHLTFWALTAATVAIASLSWFLPRHTPDAAAARWRPRTPRVPAGARREFAAGALGISAAYSLGALFLALGAQIARQLIRSDNALVDGVIISFSAIMIGVIALITRRLPARISLTVGPLALAVGLAALIGSGLTHSLLLFIASSVLGGAGYSLLFSGGLAMITASAPAPHRAAVISAGYVTGYATQAATALGLGAIAGTAGLLTAIEVGTPLLLVLAVAAGVLAHARGRRSRSPVPASPPSPHPHEKAGSMTTLTDSIVLVTGANGGLGREFVRQALSRGAARVYATARTPRDWDDDRVVPLTLDVTDRVSIAAAAAAARDVSIVINNAGATIAGGILDAPLDEVRQLFETNVFGPLEIARAFAPVLAANGGGGLVDIHSALSWLGRGGAYSATKAAFWSVTNSLRLDLAAQGTQVVGAHLGYTDTPMTANVTAAKADPVDIVAAIYDGLEAGEHEVLADETSRQVKSALSAPLTVLYPELA